MASESRVQRWARQAPRGQVFTTALIGAFSLVLLAIVAVPDDRDDPFAASTALGAGTATVAGAAPSVDGSLAIVDGVGAAAAAQGGAGSSAAPGGQVSDAAPTVVGAGAGGSGGAPASSTAAQPGEVPKATDQGVTAEAIKLGLFVSRPAGISATGFALGIRQDDKEAWQAMLDHVNAAGGVHGRKLTATILEADPTNRTGWQADCLKMTEDEKVFSVLNPSGYIGIGHQCYIEHQVPQVTASPVSNPASTFQQAGGYLASGGASADRVMLNWASTMLEAGVLVPGTTKLGLLTDECPEYVELWKAVKSFLAESDIEFVEVQTSCDTGAAQQQVPSAVLQMRQSGVDRVFLGVIFTTAQTFMQQAQAQNWKPKYSVSDLWGNNVDVLSENFPPEQFDRTIATAYTHSGEEPAKVPYSVGVKRCNDILVEAGLPGITDQMGTDASVISACDTFFVWLAIMEKLPVNFTRAQWAAAVPEVGVLATPALGASATFRPGKFDGGDSYALIEWRRECTCWVQVRAHQPGRF